MRVRDWGKTSGSWVAKVWRRSNLGRPHRRPSRFAPFWTSSMMELQLTIFKRQLSTSFLHCPNRRLSTTRVVCAVWYSLVAYVCGLLMISLVTFHDAFLRSAPAQWGNKQQLFEQSNSYTHHGDLYHSESPRGVPALVRPALTMANVLPTGDAQSHNQLLSIREAHNKHLKGLCHLPFTYKAQYTKYTLEWWTSDTTGIPRTEDAM